MNSVTYNISAKPSFPPHILRIAKIARQKSRINAKAKGEENQSQTVQPPVLKLKCKPGAHKGNRNALKHGLYSEPVLALKRNVSYAISRLRRAASEIRFKAAMMDAETAIMRRGSEPG